MIFKNKSNLSRTLLIRSDTDWSTAILKQNETNVDVATQHAKLYQCFGVPRVMDVNISKGR